MIKALRDERRAFCFNLKDTELNSPQIYENFSAGAWLNGVVAGFISVFGKKSGKIGFVFLRATSKWRCVCIHGRIKHYAHQFTTWF